MRILFDTNVLIAAFLTRGSSNEVFEHCLSEHTICVSRGILDELERSLLRKLRFPQLRVREVVRFVSEQCELVEAAPLHKPLSRDPDDDHVLGAAIGGRVDCILTGDQDLLVLRAVGAIRILSPADFWRFETAEED